MSQEKFKLWPQAALHTQWPGNGEANDPATIQLATSQLPAIKDFDAQQPMVRDALIALVDTIGPSILMTHSQGGAFGWPVADARPDKVKVKSGETLADIAKRWGNSVPAIMMENNMVRDTVKPGQTLKLPPKGR